jgi:hypothetical protein
MFLGFHLRGALMERAKREEKIDVIVPYGVYCTCDTARAQNTDKDMGDARGGGAVHFAAVLLPRYRGL